ncbi:hypothetical protein CYMTET_32967 [Cymbomonas tetramitiformis]|uniref:Glucosamine-6-phosphate deaminase n=1 Tax=Cymbomonas tetramitiformis TaxID=36881 RepID=A0AAE0FDZ9_9CHLO|nr:hypothetical protein CYMTET_32967 [Cymbomonas tetramitiformis]
MRIGPLSAHEALLCAPASATAGVSASQDKVAATACSQALEASSAALLWMLIGLGALCDAISVDEQIGRFLVALCLVDVHERGGLTAKGVGPAAGKAQKSTFVHTAPHHDDIMLGYLPYVQRLIREASNDHLFCYATSGFNAVTNTFAAGHLRAAAKLARSSPGVQALIGNGHFLPDVTATPFKISALRDVEVDIALEGHALRDEELEVEGLRRRMLRIVACQFYSPDAPPTVEWLAERCEEAAVYYEAQHAGQKDSSFYQTLKGMMREFEGDLLWGYNGFRSSDYVRHLRLGFYKGDLFTENPEMDRDVVPCLTILEEKKPAIVSVALDPEGSGPDTHYKVLQAVAAACKLQMEKGSGDRNMRVWGYRNVWYRFHPSEANLFIPVSLSEHAALCDAFSFSFISQKTASFPSPDYDGHFSHVSQRIQAEQYRDVRILLGADYFDKHPDPCMRAARGLILLHDLSVEEFAQRARDLHSKAEGSAA